MSNKAPGILGRRVIELRKEAGLSRDALSSISGVSRATLQLVEYDSAYEPRVGVLEALADCFDVSIDYLVGRHDQKRHYFNINW